MSGTQEVFLKHFQKTRFFIKIVGMDIFVSNFKYNKMTYILLIDIAFYYVVQIYSAYIFRHNFEIFIFCLVTFGFGITVGLEKFFNYFFFIKFQLFLGNWLYNSCISPSS